MAKELTCDQAVAATVASDDQEMANLDKAYAEEPDEDLLLLVVEITVRLEAAEEAGNTVDMWIYRLALLAFTQAMVRYEQKGDDDDEDAR